MPVITYFEQITPFIPVLLKPAGGAQGSSTLQLNSVMSLVCIRHHLGVWVGSMQDNLSHHEDDTSSLLAPRRRYYMRQLVLMMSRYKIQRSLRLRNYPPLLVSCPSTIG